MLIDRWILEMTELQVAQFLGIAVEGWHSRRALPLVSDEIFLRLQFEGRMCPGYPSCEWTRNRRQVSFVSMKKPTAATH